MNTRNIKQSFWNCWSALHGEVYRHGPISDFKLVGLLSKVKGKTIEIVDLLTEIEEYTSLVEATKKES